MIKTKTKKTNKQWYLYKKFGSYFKLEEDILIETSIADDGTPDEEEACDVDWDYGVEPKNRKRLKAIVKELEEKE